MSSSPSWQSPNWTPPTVAELQKMLPRYKIESMIGHGGMGAVYKGIQEDLERSVAIKILPESLVSGEDENNFAERFRLEAKAMAGLDHPAIISVFDFGQTESGHLYFVMEFIDGMDIQKFIELSGGKVAPEHAISIVSHVLDALEYAHGKGIVHRDIKPANILINSEGKIKIADFGLAKRISLDENESVANLTMSNVAVGTPDFVAPEALDSEATVDSRADLYAVGVMLYQLLTGKLPRGIFSLPSEVLPDLDKRFDDVITYALESNPDFRYQSATQFRSKLGELLTKPVPKVVPAEKSQEVESGVTGSPGQSRVAPGRSIAAVPQHQMAAANRRARKSSVPVFPWAVAVCLLAGAGYWFLNRDDHSEAETISSADAPSLSPVAEKQTSEPVESPKPAPTHAKNEEPEQEPVARKSSGSWPTGPHFQTAGRFRAWSSIPNDPDLDISKLKDVTDPKQVELSADTWVVLRENGETLSGNANAELENIEKILPGGKAFGLLTRNSELHAFNMAYHYQAPGFSQGLKGVKDAYLSWHFGAALMEDDSVRIWGLAADGVESDIGPEWSKEFIEKPIPEGRKAVGISGNPNEFYIHLDDGSILVRLLNRVSVVEDPFPDFEVREYVEVGKSRVGIPISGGQAVSAKLFPDDTESARIPHSGTAKHLVVGEVVALILNDQGEVFVYPNPNESTQALSEVLSNVRCTNPTFVSVMGRIPLNKPAHTKLLWYEQEETEPTTKKPSLTEHSTEDKESSANEPVSEMSNREPSVKPGAKKKEVVPEHPAPEVAALSREITKFQTARINDFAKLVGFYQNALEKFPGTTPEVQKLVQGEAELILEWRDECAILLRSENVVSIPEPPPLPNGTTKSMQRNRETLSEQLERIDSSNRRELEAALKQVISDLNRDGETELAKQAEAYRVELAYRFPVTLLMQDSLSQSSERIPPMLTEISLRKGKLRSWSSEDKDPITDLSRAEDREDFVQVYTFQGGWIALTADGTTISSDPKYDRVRIAKICRGWENSFGLIDFDGILEVIAADEAKPSSELQGVVDAFVSDIHSIALFSDGTIETWGPAYRGETGDRIPWEPAPKNLRRIERVLGGPTVGAAVSKDGELTAWTSNGPGRFSESARLGIRDIVARPTGLRILNSEGVFFWWNSVDSGSNRRLDLIEEVGPLSEIYDTRDLNLLRAEGSDEIFTDSRSAKASGIERQLILLEGAPEHSFSCYDSMGRYRLLWIDYDGS